jgi:hypothetical protein
MRMENIKGPLAQPLYKLPPRPAVFLSPVERENIKAEGSGAMQKRFAGRGRRARKCQLTVRPQLTGKHNHVLPDAGRFPAVGEQAR